MELEEGMNHQEREGGREGGKGSPYPTQTS